MFNRPGYQFFCELSGVYLPNLQYQISLWTGGKTPCRDQESSPLHFHVVADLGPVLDVGLQILLGFFVLSYVEPYERLDKTNQ